MPVRIRKPGREARLEAHQESRSATPHADAAPTTGLSPRGALAFVAGLLLPGAGHLLSGRFLRGALLALVLIGGFVLGILLHGRLATVDVENRLSFFFVFADAGSGLLYLGCLLAHIGVDVAAKNPTYEYGTSLLHVVGLLNYLAALDAYDIAVGRKP